MPYLLAVHATEPARAALGAEGLFVGAHVFARLVKGAGGFGAAEEVDVDAADAIVAELYVAGAKAWVLRAGCLPADERSQVLGNGFGGSFGKDASLGGASGCKISDSKHVRKLGFERARIDDDPAVFGQASCNDDVGRAVLGMPKN